MLRELELLPVWKLRQPLPEPTQIPVAETTELTSGVSQATDVSPVPATPELPVALSTSEKPEEIKPAEAVPELLKPLRALPSEDGTYLFLLQPALPDEATEVLLQNMLRAMRVICRTETEDSVEHIFRQHMPKLLICFGEETANQLTQQSLDMAQWRSHQPHHFQQLPLVVTFTPQHLLQHHEDKALAWQDLCLAMHCVQNL